MTFGKRLNELIVKKGIRQIDVAAACGVTDSTVNHWIHERKEPRIRYLPLIAEILGVSISELLEGVYETNNPTCNHTCNKSCSSCK